MKMGANLSGWSRRRFLALMGWLGLLSLPGAGRARPERRLSRREAAFYRRGR